MGRQTCVTVLMVAVGCGSVSAPKADAPQTADSSGDGQGGCPGGMTACGTECVDTTMDMNHCGACNTSCSATSPSTAQCMASRCYVTLANASDMSILPGGI